MANGSISLVLLNSTDDLSHQGQQVRFDVSTTTTTEPHASLKGYQAGVVVYSGQTGYSASYPWPCPWSFTLSSGAWTRGAADCDATLCYFKGRDSVTLGTLGFHVHEESWFVLVN